ncbi:MAG: hypothetical protein FJ333_07650, partial [Sphingomonadales bacterium]|nr:hypothetical protein [Sphingomonadales bacterium]
MSRDRELFLDKNQLETVCHVWDSEGSPPQESAFVVIWSNFQNSSESNFISLPSIIDNHSDDLRIDYLAWIYKLGETNLDGRRVLEHLNFGDNFSYWWVTSVAQKFNLSEISQHNEAIKVLALEKYVLKCNPHTSLTLTSSNLDLDKCLKSYCNSKGIKYKFNRTPSTAPKKSLRFFFNLLPESLKGLMFLLRYLFRATKLRTSDYDQSVGQSSSAIFFDILVHLNNKEIDESKFSSNYWTLLVDKLYEWKKKSSWVHLFFSHPGMLNIKKANEFIGKLNNNSNSQQKHCLLERRLPFLGYVRVFRNFIQLKFFFSKIKAISYIKPDNYSINPWFFHTKEWRESFFGTQAMDNCIKYELFRYFLLKIPKQPVGFFISENQPWEFFLI